MRPRRFVRARLHGARGRLKIRTGMALAAVSGAMALAILIRAHWPVPIRDVLIDTERFAGRRITVRGVAAHCFQVPPRGRGIFRVQDRTGKILVVTDKSVPPPGGRVTTRGWVQQSRVYGTVIVTGRRELE